MDFVGAIQSGFRNFTNFRGVAGRSEYWYWVLFTVLASLTASALDRLTGIGIFGTIVWFATFFPNLAVLVRRLRDAGKSWIWLLSLLPGLVLSFAGFAMVAYDLYNFGYVTSSAQLNDPNFPSEELIQQILGDSRFYQSFTVVLVGLALSFVFSLISSVIFTSRPSKSYAEGNKWVPPTL